MIPGTSSAPRPAVGPLSASGRYPRGTLSTASTAHRRRAAPGDASARPRRAARRRGAPRAAPAGALYGEISGFPDIGAGHDREELVFREDLIALSDADLSGEITSSGSCGTAKSGMSDLLGFPAAVVRSGGRPTGRRPAPGRPGRCAGSRGWPGGGRGLARGITGRGVRPGRCAGSRGWSPGAGGDWQEGLPVRDASAWPGRPGTVRCSRAHAAERGRTAPSRRRPRGPAHRFRPGRRRRRGRKPVAPWPPHASG